MELSRFLRRAAVALPALALVTCGEEAERPTTTSPEGPVAFDVSFVRSAPAPAGTLVLAAPNDTPVSFTVTFSVAVPRGQEGTYQWNTAVQAAHPAGTGFVVPVVTTAFRPVPLGAGVQEVTLSDFHTTNAICQDPRSPGTTQSLDVDVRLASASLAQGGSQILGKRFEVSYALECR